MSKQKLEQVLEYLINNEEEQARDLLHTVFVEKARDIHESLIDDEDEEIEEKLENDDEEKEVDESSARRDFERQVTNPADEIAEISDEIDSEEQYEGDK